jgi:hypothetical protein
MYASSVGYPETRHDRPAEPAGPIRILSPIPRLCAVRLGAGGRRTGGTRPGMVQRKIVARSAAGWVVRGAAAPSVGRFQTREELLQQSLELGDLVGVEATKELPIALGDGGDRLVDEPRALVGELDDDAAAIVGVG